MTKKIYLSPSEQPANTYAYGNTNEKVQCRRISAVAADALTRCGFEVIDATSKMLSERCKESNEWGADLHVPIHTNAYNGKVSGTRIMCYSLTGERYKAAKAVYDALAPITPGKSENVSAAPKLYEVKHTKAPCVYIEVDFHDVPDIAKWIIKHTEEIGEAICKGICNYYGVEYKAATDAESAYSLEQFIRDVQAATGSVVDGIAGPETIGNTVTVSAQKNRTHPVVRFVQKRLYALGYTQVGAADGIAGPKFECAVIAFQAGHGCWVDGELTAKNKTWRKLLGMA